MPRSHNWSLLKIYQVSSVCISRVFYVCNMPGSHPLDLISLMTFSEEYELLISSCSLFLQQTPCRYLTESTRSSYLILRRAYRSS
jgi:hypothetical protein